MTEPTDGGEADLAPVIPLFGARGALPEHPSSAAGARQAEPGADAPADPDAPADAEGAVDDASRPVEPSASDADGWHTTWRDLRVGRPQAVPAVSTTVRDGVRFLEIAPDPADADGAAATEAVEAAEARLLRALRSRSLSVSEVRSRLRQDGVDAADVDAIVDRLERLGALDDAALAEQLVHVGTTRKNQGRRAIAQALSARGIARDVVDAALAELPDDDEERALEFARGKAQSLVRYDEDTALRRLVGQLGRRGFGGSLAMSAARRALEEARGGGGGRGVRFR
jgi:regulatory protein